MNILIITPTLRPHGGVRVILEWAKHLAKNNHTVLQCVDGGGDCIPDESVHVLFGKDIDPKGFDVIISCSPQITWMLHAAGIKYPVVHFLQMCEELFDPVSPNNQKIISSYFADTPIITIAHWIAYRLRNMGVRNPIHVVGNGYDLDFWKETGEYPERHGVLLANVSSYNQCKDVQGLTLKAGKYLQQKHDLPLYSYGFGRQPAPFIDHHERNVDAVDLRSLYNRVNFTVQATRIDAWSTVGVESLACKTPIVRAIKVGDEYLQHLVNCRRTSYELDELIYQCDLMIEKPIWSLENLESWSVIAQTAENIIKEYVG